MIGTFKNRLNDLFSNQGFKKYFGSTSWLLAHRVLGLFGSLFIGIWVARYLGPTDYGTFNYIQSLVGIFAIVASLGLDSLIVRELLDEKNNNQKLLGSALGLKIFGSILLFFIILILAFTLNLNYENRTYCLIVVLATFCQSYKVIEFYFTSTVQGKFIAQVNIVSLVISSALKVLLILTNQPLVYFFWVLVIESFIISVGLVILYKLHVGSLLKWKFDFITVKVLLKDGWPLILSGFVIMIYMRIDQVMIEYFIDSKSVGIYAVAARLSELWYFVPAIIADSLFPAILNVKKDEALFQERIKNLYSLMFFLAIGIALPITFIGGYVIEFLYGIEYKDAGEVLKIHVWSAVFVFIGFIFNKYLILKNWTKLAFYRTLIGAIANIVLNIILIPNLGISGAAIATLISQAVSNYFFDIFNKNLHEQFIIKTKSFFSIPKNIR